jgi:hypothetical protein
MRLRCVVLILILIGIWGLTLICYVSEAFWLAFLESATDYGGWDKLTLQHPTGQEVPLYGVYFHLGKEGPSNITIPNGTWCFGLDKGAGVRVHCQVYEGDSRNCGEDGWVCGNVSKEYVKYAPPPNPLRTSNV